MDARMFTLLGLTCSPLMEMTCPKNFPEDTPNVHLVGFNLSHVLLSVSKVLVRSMAYSSIQVLLITMSST